MPDNPNILVVGSLNMDLVVRTEDIPTPGQTVTGSNFTTTPGGKGANQAVAAAALGAECTMVGMVGDDAFGRTLKETLQDRGVRCEHLGISSEAPTGAAMIIVDSRGENTIVVAGGANLALSPDDVFACEGLFERADVVLLQLEMSMPVVRAAISLGKRCGCKIVLDPAPAPKVLPEEISGVDLITPNVTEAETITGKKAVEERVDKLVAAEFIARGAKAAALKLGHRGCMVVTEDEHFYRVDACRVPVVDATGAGDAFTAAIAVAMARGEGLHQAAKFANAAGALACTKLGAISAMPAIEHVHALMEDQPR